MDRASADVAVIHCEQIQYFRAAGQMVAPAVGDAEGQDETIDGSGQPEALGEPVVALLDGLPLQRHVKLAGRLLVDDPEGYESSYAANERVHGTAMASLILHGDLCAQAAPLARKLYVRPILRPNPLDFRSPRVESSPDSILTVDLIHRAVVRLFEAAEQRPPIAASVCVVNLSIGIGDRPFDGALSPLARLLDWLAWKYDALFIVSAGNCSRDISLGSAARQLAAATPEDRQAEFVRSVAADARHRRLLSPSEAVNVLTVAATHRDASTAPPLAGSVVPFADDGLPSLINAQGMGYRRAIKPDVLMPGGRVLLAHHLTPPPTGSRLHVMNVSRAPGQKVASPGTAAGDLSSSRHSRGTSNATALASRAASQMYDVLDDLAGLGGGELLERVPRATWIKAMLVHGASWGPAGVTLERLLKTAKTRRQFKEYVTRLLGYGEIAADRVTECSRYRVTALSGGALRSDQAHIHKVPLPPSLSGVRGWRRLTVTLAWISAINSRHQSWRRADLWFAPTTERLGVARQQADWRAVQRGTVQHEILEGEAATAYVDGDTLEIKVSCRADAGDLDEPTRYALVISLEVAEDLGIDIYDEVRARVEAAPVRVTASAG